MRSRQWSRFQHEVRQQAVRRLSAASQAGRLRRDRDRTGDRPAHHQPPQRQGLGRGPEGRRRRVLFLDSPATRHAGHEDTRMRDDTAGTLGRILLVEDDAKDIDLTLRALDEFRLANEVFVVRDGEEALDYLYCRGRFANRTSETPAVLLLDIKLPEVDGLEVLQQIKSDSTLRMIPVVMLTSSREERDMVASYRLGVNAYVVKPVEFQEFVNAIKELGFF